MSNKHTGSKNATPQLSLFGLGTKPDFEHNYFFALSPGVEVRDRLGEVAEELRVDNSLNGSWIASERYHITLHHLGQFPDVRADLVSRATTAANKIQAKSFDVTLDQFMSFESKTGKFPCVLTNSVELTELQKFWLLLKNNLFAVRLGQNLSNNFKPHATMLYSRQPIAPKNLVKPIHWRVKDFVLIESLVGKSEHIELGRWPLSD